MLLPHINCSFLQARDEIMVPHRWSVLKSSIRFIACPEASWSSPLNSGKSTLSLIWEGKFLIRKSVVVWEKKKKYLFLNVFLTFATDLCDMDKSHKSSLLLSSSCLLKTGKPLLNHCEKCRRPASVNLVFTREGRSTRVAESTWIAWQMIVFSNVAAR